MSGLLTPDEARACGSKKIWLAYVEGHDTPIQVEWELERSLWIHDLFEPDFQDEDILGLAPYPHDWLPMEQAPRDGRRLLLLLTGCTHACGFSQALDARNEERGWAIVGAQALVGEADVIAWQPIVMEGGDHGT